MHTSNRIDFLNITEQVRKAVRESGIEDGIVLINAMHITASVFVNDNESGLLLGSCSMPSYRQTLC